VLITDYAVGRDAKKKPLCLVVKGVLLTDCQTGPAVLNRRATRTDLVQSFVQDSGEHEFIVFPDLPSDVIELLVDGASLTIHDDEDQMEISCMLEQSAPKVATK